MEDYFRIFLQTWKFNAELIERFCVLCTHTLACMNLMLSRSFKADGTIVFNSYKLMICISPFPVESEHYIRFMQ